MTRYYTYKVTFKDLPRYFYYGRKKDDGKPYFGSPVTWRHLWDFFEPEVQILQWYDTFEEVERAEYALIKHTWEEKHSLNENLGGFFSEDVCRENGFKNNEALQLHPNTFKARKENLLKMQSHPNTKRSINENLSIHRSEHGRVNGGRSKELGLGIHSQTKEDHSRFGKSGGEAMKERLSKRVLCIDTGEEFPSALEASKEKEVSYSSLKKSARSKGRYTAGGLRWQYLEKSHAH